MKVLVIGAAGRFGQMAIPLISASHELTLVDYRAGESNGQKIHALDITDFDAVLAAMQGHDAVINLAIASQREFVTDADMFDADLGDEYLRFNEATIEVNIRGAYHVYEAARQAGAKRVILGSSLTVLLGQPSYGKYSDNLPVRPVNFYAVSKIYGEHLGELYARKHGLTVYCLRFGQPYPIENDPKGALRLASPAGRRASVTYDDLASSMEAALTVQNGPAFGTYIIVSDAEDPHFDTAKAAEIGWKSKTRCEQDGSITPLS